MTERLRSGSYANSQISAKMANDLTPRKTMLILVIVVGCFAVLWPKVFYPMLVGSANQHMKPSPIDKTTGCCDVISETDVNTIKIMSELCRTIIKRDEDTPLTGREIVAKCQNAVLETCGIDISAVLQEQVKLGQTVKQILDEVRSLNGSLCLKYNFGVSPWRLGVPHRITVSPSSSSIKQERPLHLRSEMVHPAFRERGRAIPHPQPATPSRPSPRIVEGRPGPIPAMRPTLGGAGHVVPPPKQSTGSMGLIMPIYTIGIVIFFTYTVMKIVFKKQPEALYPPVEPDPHFRREVFESERGQTGPKLTRDSVSSKLGDAELDQLRRRLRETELAMERIVEQMAKVPLKLQDVVANGNIISQQEEDQPTVKVLGMEMTASCEGGKKWSRPDSPVLPASAPPVPEPLEPPQEIFLEGALPAQSHLLVANSATEAQKTASEEDPAVVLAGKMTLSVISLDSSENGTDESSNSGKKQGERSSSNVSEEFEKIEIDNQLEDQINNIIEEAQIITGLVQKEEKPNLLEELENEIKQIDAKLEQIDRPIEIPGVEQIYSENIDKARNSLLLQEIEKELMEKEGIGTSLDQIDIPPKRLRDEEQVESKNVEVPDSRLVFQEIEKKILENESQIGSKEPVIGENITKTEEKVLETLPIKTEQKPIAVEPGQLTEKEIAIESNVGFIIEKTEEKILNGQKSPEPELLIDKREDQQAPIEQNLEIEKSIAENLDEEIKEVIQEKEVISEEAVPESDVVPSMSKETKKALEKEIISAETPTTDIVEKQTEGVVEDPSFQSPVSDPKKEVPPDLTDSIKEQTSKFTEKEVANEEQSISEETQLSDSKIEEIEKPVETIENAPKARNSTDEEIQPIESAENVQTTEEETFEKLNEAIADLSAELKSASTEEPIVPIEDPVDADDEEIEYEYEESDNEAVDDEIRNVDRVDDLGDQEFVEQINGDDQEQSKYVTTSSATLAENEISDEENLQNENEDEDEEEEIEEIIEYITDDEEEAQEVVQPIERNNVNHVNERSDVHH